MSVRKLIVGPAKLAGFAFFLVAVVGIYLGPDADRGTVSAELARQFANGLLYGTTDPSMREKARSDGQQPVEEPEQVGRFLTSEGEDIGQSVRPAAESLGLMRTRRIELRKQEIDLEHKQRRERAIEAMKKTAASQ